MTQSPPPPPDWPSRADEDYERIRVLGAGAFGEVWLARSKRLDENRKHQLVAIKGVSTQNENEGATAAREMAILGELNHPNIIRLLHGYEPASPTAKGWYMALSYVDGPDLGELLEERGALGLPLAQIVARDLVSAVAYCHARGVMHRDIKPDNIMLEGCREGKKWLHDDAMWGDDRISAKRKFKAVLADFGFARATSEKDYEVPEEEDDKQTKKPVRLNRSMDRKMSMVMFQAKSAIGTRHFTAPEIVGSVRKKRDSEVGLTECVSSYGLISDAYAVGATLSEVCTGVPPGQDVETYVKQNRKKDPKRQGSLSKMTRKFLRSLSSGASNHSVYDVQLRYMHELPDPAKDLITGLMKEDMYERTSVREAQDHEWIGGYDALTHGDVSSREDSPIVYIRHESALM
eukprot:CAMPEP_0172569714 /NCGR_PEP_ID=MMETSP1067-20121228/124705_1 /TAXON_ID=265564 ORGANISM="Thalassiosira punctigera, Strain Tpunct2005C2" /NCGR_SAMPLE_ID=MMETSP1067 /ASSEMBLY_ACC=CAM_ASM_000444 /LENGTH=403 /DNA_ID=CAMNT_0013361605 /DNA_START=49 /DNA_END=1260 /DNA_ORIENTATION=-